MIVAIGIIAAQLFIFVTFFKLGLGTETAQLIIEQVSIGYYITASANSLAIVDEGRVEIEFRSTYDLIVSFEEPSYYLTVKYTDFNDRAREIKIPFLTEVKETTISSVGTVCIAKENGGDVEVKREC